MTLLAAYFIALALWPLAANAAASNCSDVSSRKARHVCHETQKLEKQAEQTPSRMKMEEDIGRMKRENDRLNARLQGICRGC
jgi:hypothetical protein